MKKKVDFYSKENPEGVGVPYASCEYELTDEKCNDCKHADTNDTYCVNCTHRFEPGTMARLKAKDCFKSKEKEHSSNCTISVKEWNKAFKNEDYGFKEISNDEEKIQCRQNDKDCYVDGLTEILDPESLLKSFLTKEDTPQKEVEMIKAKIDRAIKYYEDEIQKYHQELFDHNQYTMQANVCHSDVTRDAYHNILCEVYIAYLRSFIKTLKWIKIGE